MNGMVVLLLAMAWFALAYWFYGRLLARRFGVEPGRPTPAHARRDGVDYVPTRLPVLFGHHFASIAGAGPIVGPVAAIYLGWFPTLMWILLGCVLIGAFHDFAAMFLSVRDEGRSIGHVIERQIGFAGRQIFLLFSWAALVLVVAIFALLVAKTFVSTPSVATASLLFVAMAPVFGWLVNRGRLSLAAGSFIFVPLLFAGVWVGTRLPLDLAAAMASRAASAGHIALSPAAVDSGLAALARILAAQPGVPEAAASQGRKPDAAVRDAAAAIVGRLRAAAQDPSAPLNAAALEAAGREAALAALTALGLPQTDVGEAAGAFSHAAIRSHAADRAWTIWMLVLLLYCFVASVVPVWILLQPRDYLNSYLLYAMMALGFVGILAYAPSLRLPAFAGWVAENAKGRPGAVFPLLFVTVACGACSGFHALVASGTSAKQVHSEGHILPVGYGGMLVEGLLAVMSLISVGYLTRGEYNQLVGSQGDVAAFATGLATFCTRLHVPLAAGTTFVALAISAFMLTTLDTATRLTRFAWQELFLPRSSQAERRRPSPFSPAGAVPATTIAVGAAAYLAFSGEGMAIWPVFGASNQLLAALTLLAITLYLVRRRTLVWAAFLPMVFMLVVSGWALVLLLAANWGRSVPLVVATAFLLAMAAILAALAVCSLWRARLDDAPGAAAKPGTPAS